jgi:hypothetical protein
MSLEANIEIDLCDDYDPEAPLSEDEQMELARSDFRELFMAEAGESDRSRELDHYVVAHSRSAYASGRVLFDLDARMSEWLAAEHAEIVNRWRAGWRP